MKRGPKRIELTVEAPVDFDTTVFFLAPKPCPKGHLPAIKRRDNGTCRECCRLRAAAWAERNLERKRRRNRNYMNEIYKNDPVKRDAKLAYNRKYLKRKREKKLTGKVSL